MFERMRFLCNARIATYALTLFLISTASVRAQHHAMVEWYADLSEPGAARGDASVTHSSDIGRVTVTVDFPHHTVTFHTRLEGVTGLRRIEVHTTAESGDAAGPALFIIYDARKGRFAGESTRTVEESRFSDVATPILNSRAEIVIATDAHPDGEVVGQIVMHKHYE